MPVEKFDFCAKVGILMNNLDDMVWRAVILDRGSSTAKKTAMTTINIMVVLFASL